MRVGIASRARTIRRLLRSWTPFTIARVLLHIVALVGLCGTAIVADLAEDFFTRGVENAPSWPPVPYTSGNPMGINTFLNEEPDPAVVARSLDMIAAGGFGYIRQIFGW